MGVTVLKEISSKLDGLVELVNENRKDCNYLREYTLKDGEPVNFKVAVSEVEYDGIPGEMSGALQGVIHNVFP